MRAEAFIENNVVEINQLQVVQKDDALEAVKIAHNDAVKKWVKWCFNYPCPFEKVICQIWGGTLSEYEGRYYCSDNHVSQHFIEKWRSLASRGDARMLFFCNDLDYDHRKRLVDWIMENYGG